MGVCLEEPPFSYISVDIASQKALRSPPSPPASGSRGEVSFIATQVHTPHSNRSLQGLSQSGVTHSKHRVSLQFSILTAENKKNGKDLPEGLFSDMVKRSF